MSTHLRRSGFAIVLWICASMAGSARADDGARVFAASSLTDVLERIAAGYHAETGRPLPVLSFASSSKLARQVEAGAPADLVMTADARWMDVLERAHRIVPSTRRSLLGNRLVAVVPSGASVVPGSARELKAASVRRIAVAGEAVPAGRRAREALAHVGLLEVLRPRLVQASNVRAALALAARDEVDAAIVYGTDARASSDVEEAFTFDAGGHSPIVYPLALTQSGIDRVEARSFYDYLLGARARVVFASAGFDVLGGRGQERLPAEPALDAPAGPEAAVTLAPLPLSLWVAAMSLLLSAVPALLLGWLMARRDFPGKTLLSTALMTPLVLPPVVTGYLLLSLFGRNGVLSPVLQSVGLQVAFSRHGAVVAAAVVGFPLLILMTRLAIESVDPRYEQLAETLGQRPLEAFLKVTVPMASPGLAAGAVLAFARGLGEFGATAMLAGDVPGQTRTLSLAVYALYEQPGREPEAARLVWISLLLCLVALAGYERLSRLQKRRLQDQAR